MKPGTRQEPTPEPERPMRRARSGAAATLAAGLLVLLLGALAAAAPGRPTLGASVVDVVDGDTIRVRLTSGATEKVRYIGVDTPETRHPTRGEEPWGREATAVNRRLVAGKTVGLELDVQHRDRYGRLLAYVWVGDTMVNAELVRLGYAQAMTVPPNVRYERLFVRLQREAREAGRGLWDSSRAALR